MKLGFLDLETYYDKDYSLSKLTTEEYIRDPRFEIIGVGLYLEGWDDARWFSGTHKETRQWLLQHVDWDDIAMGAHNAVFDMAILNWVLDIRPKVIIDTLSMSRPLHGLQVGGSLKALAAHYGIGVKGEEVHNFLGYRRADFTPQELAAYGRYCCNDTILGMRLFHKMAPRVNKEELKVIDTTIRMFTEPKLVLNKAKLLSHLADVRQRKRDLMAQIARESLGMDGEFTGDLLVDGTEQAVKKLLMSNDKFADLLRKYGVEPPMKNSPTAKNPDGTPKRTYAFAKTDEAFLALEDHPDEMVQALVAARLGLKSTLEETRTERFIDMADRGPMPVPIKYCAAHTTRFGGMDKINMQNLPARGVNGGKLKACIEAPEGHVIIDCDSSQIEARCLAWVAEQNDLVEGFRRKEDVYSDMATSIYGRPINRKYFEIVNGEQVFPMEKEGFVGKGTVLGAGYGMGPSRFVGHMRVAGVELDLRMAQHIIATYRNKYPRIPDLWYQTQECLEAMIDKFNIPQYGNGAIKFDPDRGFLLPNGFWLEYYNLRRVKNKESGRWELVYDQRKGRGLVPTYIHGAKAVENIIQGLARCVVTHQMVKIAREYQVVLTVHDANAIVAPEDRKDEARAYVEQCMRTVPPWGTANGIVLPLDCESSMTKHYS